MALTLRKRKQCIDLLIEDLGKKDSPMLYMQHWFSDRFGLKGHRSEYNECGTKYCIAGRIPLLDKYMAKKYRRKGETYHFYSIALDVLDIGSDSHPLFKYLMGWEETSNKRIMRSRLIEYRSVMDNEDKLASFIEKADSKTKGRYNDD